MKQKLTYFISRSSMFGIGFYLLFKNNGKDAWISLLLGTLIGIGIIYIYHFIKDYFQDKNFKDILSNTLIGKFYIFLFLLFNFYIILIILILLPMFVNSFYLLYTPKILVVIPFVLLVLYLAFKDSYVILSLSNLLYYASIVIILIYGLLIIKYIDFSNLTPIYTSSNLSIIKSSLLYASITSIPHIITLEYASTLKEDLKNYIIASMTNFMILILTILSLGEPLIKIYSFPEYDVLKQIKILDFIENIENLSTFIWYFDMFITLAVLTRNIKSNLPHKFNKLTFLISITLITILATFIIGENYRLISIMFTYYPLILFIFFMIFITLLIYLKKRKNTQ